MLSLGLIFWIFVIVAFALWIAGRFPGSPGSPTFYAAAFPVFVFILVLLLGLEVFGGVFGGGMAFRH